MPKHIGSSKIIRCRIPNSKRFNDIKGSKYGRLTVLNLAGKKPYESGYRYYWKCLCACGSLVTIEGVAVKMGNTQSCGCLKSEITSRLTGARNLKHGKKWTPEYGVWINMRVRCRSPKDQAFKNYGGRGIKVCERWERFENFIADMGTRPTALHTIERLDTDGNYDPANCVWETRKRQNRNKRNNRVLTFMGLKMCIADWADKTGILADNIYNRLSMGWSIKRALTQTERHW